MIIMVVFTAAFSNMEYTTGVTKVHMTGYFHTCAVYGLNTTEINTEHLLE
jgi:hypothetical protein